MTSTISEQQVRQWTDGTAKKDVFYSLCPVPVASHVALDLGWIDEEVNRAGGKLSYLRAAPDDEGLWPHVGHRSDALIRDGGNSPPIWARADISETRLVAITFANDSGGHILVRADSDFFRVADLKGKKIGLVKGLNKSKIDFLRAPSERGVLLALKLAGLSPADVEIVDIEHDDTAVEPPSRSPAERLIRLSKADPEQSVEVRALAEGRVDAIFSRGGKTSFLERSGKYKVIEDLGRHPDWTLRANNTPWVTTVSADLADRYPELVVAWLRAAIRAGRWINANRYAAAEIFNRTATRYPSVADFAKAIDGFDFVPNLSEQAIAGVEIEKNFLLKHGYIERDFDVRSWIEPQFFDEALASLPPARN
ncbi:MAG: ABC transporter substrate-binding protein [Methylocystaceae bacterium]|nr:MAG: ABC transporter substrate-binding protein [Methylocystaceae bacterium]